MRQLFLTLFIILLISQQAYSYSDINSFKRTIITLKNQRYPEYRLQHNTFLNKDDPLKSDDTVLRFQPVIQGSNTIKLKNRSTGRYCGIKLSTNGQTDQFSCNSDATVLIFEVEFVQDSLITLTARYNNKDWYLTTYDFYGKVGLIKSNDFSYSGNYRQWNVEKGGCVSSAKLRATGSDPYQCVLECDEGYYKGFQICIECTGCSACDAAGSCSSCQNGYIFQGDKCINDDKFTTGSIALKSKRTHRYCRDLGGRIDCDQSNYNSDVTKFRVQRRNDGYITIRGNQDNRYCRQYSIYRVQCDTYSTSSNYSQYKLHKNSDNTYSLQNKANNKYVCNEEKRKNVFFWTEHDYYYLSANRDAIGTWEKFDVVFNV